MRMTLTRPTASAIAITNNMPRISCGHDSSGSSTNDETTTQSVMRAPTDTSNAFTIRALV
jgi:hypothetical protein